MHISCGSNIFLLDIERHPGTHIVLNFFKLLILTVQFYDSVKGWADLLKDIKRSEAWSRIAPRFHGSGERSPCTDQVPPKSRKRGMLVSASTAHQSNDYTTLEKPESSIYETISLISIDDNSVKLTRNVESNKIYLHLVRDGHWQRALILVLTITLTWTLDIR